MRVELSAAARSDLLNIYEYTFGRWGEIQATRYLADLDRAIIGIGEGSVTGLPVRASKFLRSPSGSHSVFYERRPRVVRVVRILHQRQDWQRHLP